MTTSSPAPVHNAAPEAESAGLPARSITIASFGPQAHAPAWAVADGASGQAQVNWLRLSESWTERAEDAVRRVLDGSAAESDGLVLVGRQEAVQSAQELAERHGAVLASVHDNRRGLHTAYLGFARDTRKRKNAK
jgi:hypothetical protein